MREKEQGEGRTPKQGASRPDPHSREGVEQAEPSSGMDLSETDLDAVVGGAGNAAEEEVGLFPEDLLVDEGDDDQSDTSNP